MTIPQPLVIIGVTADNYRQVRDILLAYNPKFYGGITAKVNSPRAWYLYEGDDHTAYNLADIREQIRHAKAGYPDRSRITARQFIQEYGQ